MNAQRNELEAPATMQAEAVLTGAQPLVDSHGVPLLPRVAERIRLAGLAGEVLPPLENGRVRSVLDAGEGYQGIDHQLLADYAQRGRYLHDVETGELLGKAILAVAGAVRTLSTVVGHALLGFFTPAPSTEDVRRALAPGYRGVLGLNATYWTHREQYYGQGL